MPVDSELLIDLEEAYCCRIFRQIRWADGIVCPHCHSANVSTSGNYQRFLRRHHCHDCGRHFNDKTGTIFAESKLPFSKWFGTVHWINQRRSVSWISRQLGVDYNTAARIVNLLRNSPYPQQIEAWLERNREVATKADVQRTHS